MATKKRTKSTLINRLIYLDARNKNLAHQLAVEQRRQFLRDLAKMSQGSEDEKAQAREWVEWAQPIRPQMQDGIRELATPEIGDMSDRQNDINAADQMNDLFEDVGKKGIQTTHPSDIISPQAVAGAEPAPPPPLDTPKTPVPGDEAIQRKRKPEGEAPTKNEGDGTQPPQSGGDFVPGGIPPAQPPTGEQPDTSGEAEPAAEGAEGVPGQRRGGVGGVVDRAKEAAQKKIDEIKKKAKEAIKKAAARFWAWIVANAVWIVPVVIIIIVAIVIFVALYEKNKGKGKSDPQPPQYMDDKDAIVALARKSGDPDIASEVASDVADQMKQNLVLLKDSTTDTTLLTEIDALVLKIEQNQGTMDTAVATEIITDFQTVMLDVANAQAPKLATASVSPLAAIIGYNEEIHFGTPLRKEMPTGNTTGHATYMRNGEGTADAVDLYVATDAPVLAPIAGEIVDLSDDGTGYKKIVIRQGDYELLIAFVKPAATLVVGQSVTQGQALGTAAEVGGQSQIHLELAYCGKNITLDPVDKILADKEGKAIGEYLWNRFKDILNIQ